MAGLPVPNTAEHLRQWLADRKNADRVELRLKGDLTLTPPVGPAQCLFVKAKQQVIIKPLESGGSRPTIRLRYDNSQEPSKRLVALTIDSPDPGSGTLAVTVEYEVRTTNSRFNLVFPFYRTDSNELVSRL